MNPTELEAQLEGLHEESYGWALACCGWDESEAEDVLQNAYVKVISGQAEFGGRSSFKTWFFGVIRRSAQESRRRARSREKTLTRMARLQENPAVTNSGEERVERSQKTGLLLAALQRISPRQREVVHLVFYHDLSIAEAAGIMEVSLGSARTHYERAKTRLRSLLQQTPRKGAEEGSTNV